ncbi:MAG: response regulator [Gammaproteobacteria bacterium]|nr:response regulator [Gammaproteobacteria bacterium]
MKCLIVDDSLAMQCIIKRSLAKAGYNDNDFRMAIDGVQALEVIDSWMPEVVITDWHMPKMTGIELIQEIQSRKMDVKIGMLTTETDSRLIKQAQEAGALFVLHKPFEDRELKHALTTLFKDVPIDNAANFKKQKAKTKASEGKLQTLQLPTIGKLNALLKNLSISHLMVERSHSLALNYENLPYVIAIFSERNKNAARAMCILDIHSAAIFSGASGQDGAVQVAHIIESKNLEQKHLDAIQKIMAGCASLFYDPISKGPLEAKSVHLISKPSERLEKLGETAKHKRLDLVVESDLLGEGQMIFMAVADS